MGVAFDATIVNDARRQAGQLRNRGRLRLLRRRDCEGHRRGPARRREGHQPFARGRWSRHRLLAAMQRAVNAGIVLVISAGNDGKAAGR
jgi:hypothetical protein